MKHRYDTPQPNDKCNSFFTWIHRNIKIFYNILEIQSPKGQMHLEAKCATMRKIDFGRQRRQSLSPVKTYLKKKKKNWHIEAGRCLKFQGMPSLFIFWITFDFFFFFAQSVQKKTQYFAKDVVRKRREMNCERPAAVTHAGRPASSPLKQREHLFLPAALQLTWLVCQSR